MPQIRVCLIGAGRAGKVHANSLVNRIPDGKLVIMVDPASEVLETALGGLEARQSLAHHVR